MVPLMAATHFVKWPGTHRDDADLARKNDRVPIRKQCNLELAEEKKPAGPRRLSVFLADAGAPANPGRFPHSLPFHLPRGVHWV